MEGKKYTHMIHHYYHALQLDPKLSMRKYIENNAAKVRRRLNIVKKLAGTK